MLFKQEEEGGGVYWSWAIQAFCLAWEDLPDLLLLKLLLLVLLLFFMYS